MLIAEISFSLPFQNEILIFSVVLFVILFAPLLLNKIKVPPIIGLIIAGVILGPNGFHILERDASIKLFGAVGLHYIMFLAGLEIDLQDFKKNSKKSLVFGLYTFIIPMVLGTVASVYILGFPFISALLLASMFASHTLLSYPIASKMGVAKNTAVNITVGGTMITDTLALLVLAVIAASTEGELNTEFWTTLGISVTVFALFVWFVFPIIGRWFFKTFEDNVSQYIFVLAMVFFGAFLAEIAGIEGIIGAFLAGLALNRLIPHSSPLMNRIEFVGNALFIPFFLIGVGMLVDLKVFFREMEALKVATVMSILALGSKWLAAKLAQKTFKFNSDEGDMIFGLSSAQAAATLAAVLIGYNIGLLNENVLNGTVLMILVTSLVSSFFTQKASKNIAIAEATEIDDTEENYDRILVSMAHPDHATELVDLAVLLRDPKSTEPMYGLSVLAENSTAERAKASEKMLEKVEMHASGTDTELKPISRIDSNIPMGIVNAAKEVKATEILLGWRPTSNLSDRFFGTVLDKVLQKTEMRILVYNPAQPIGTIKNIVVTLPENAELEHGFGNCIWVLKKLVKQTGAKIIFMGSKKAIGRLHDINDAHKPVIEFEAKEFNDWDDFLIIGRELGKDDLLVLFNARKDGISYKKVLDKLPSYLQKYFSDNNFLMIFPEEKTDLLLSENESSKSDQIHRLSESIKGAFSRKF